MTLIERQLRDPFEWHRWFAWHPVRIWSRPFSHKYKVVWLEDVERMGVGTWGYWDYREIPPQ